MTLLGIDIGTTHVKAGLFDIDGTAIRIAALPTCIERAGESAYLDPDKLWRQAADVIRDVVSAPHAPIRAVGVASMAESGLLVDCQSGKPRSALLPWFDTSTQSQADAIAALTDAETFYCWTGLRVTYKTSLAKILWLRERDSNSLNNALWLSAADYIVYRLTGAFGTDFSLAGRTGAFEIAPKRWNVALLEQFGLSSELFPPAQRAGTPLGVTHANVCDLPAGIPVAVCGHDHVCAALGAGAVETGEVFDSMGTAEVLIGAFPERSLTTADFESGLLSGCHVMEGRSYWLGSLSTSGGAVEWLRGILNAEPLSYEALFDLANQARQTPTGILFYPYLLGSGAPQSDPLARSAWMGLGREHTRADLAKAVLEGAAFEIEFIRRAGETLSSCPITALTVAGGGARSRIWLQIKADVSGVPIHVCSEPEAALLGAAVAAGIGAGIYTNECEAKTAIVKPASVVIEPDAVHHEAYNSLYEKGYAAFKAAVHQFGQLNGSLTTAVAQKGSHQ